ncbi:MAG TPA: amidohydrolase family protein [Chloroflexota bacterium]
MKNGLKVFDTDTHVAPSAETLRPYLPASLLERIPDIEENRVPIRENRAGKTLQPPYKHWYRFRGGGNDEGGGWGNQTPRYLGEAAPRPDAPQRVSGTSMGENYPTEGGDDDDAKARLRDMDAEGVDVHYMVGGGGAPHRDPHLSIEFVRAGHRYLDDFCNTDAHRLKAGLTVIPGAIEQSIEEIKRWGKSPWCVAVHPSLPLDYPLDHPDLNPIWAAAQEENLAVIYHSFSTGYPGYRDLWDNPFLGRLASHPWGAMRAVASFFGAGIMDRFPNIRFGILESGIGWLPFWAHRMDDQVMYMGYVNEHLEYKMSEYMTGGRFFAATVLHEGEELVKMVTDLLGDHVLTFGSDYSHPESRFPTSADIPFDWTSLTQEQLRKLMWDNPVRFFGEP